ncbi:MAG: L-threonylcarbamoyladenylate synthase [Pseudanabaenaceae cyanobacterium]
MATILTVHPQNPQQRTIEQICQQLRQGAVMLYPTDTVYGIGCDLHSKEGVARVRQIKQLSSDKPLTFLCSSLSNIAHYAVVDDNAYRLMKSLIPGPYTFILPATKLVPKIVMNPKRKTTGIRVPDHKICQALLQTLGNPIISTSANWQQDEVYPTYLSKVELFDYFDKMVDLIVDDGLDLQYETSSVIDLSGETPILVRAGLGDVSHLALEND